MGFKNRFFLCISQSNLSLNIKTIFKDFNILKGMPMSVGSSGGSPGVVRGSTRVTWDIAWGSPRVRLG